MILRDDHDQDWDAPADDTLERRVYYCQNWRADVIALLADNGRVLERVWYEPYGTPHGSPAADWTTSNNSANDDYGVLDGDADNNDSSYYTTLYNASSARADLTGSSVSTNFAYGRPDGTDGAVDNGYFTAVYVAAENLSRGVLSGSASSDSLRNRKGLAGYEWDPSTSKYHVRNRVLDPETGRWTRRDPLGYVDGASLYEYVSSRAVVLVDATGLFGLRDRTQECVDSMFEDIVRDLGTGDDYSCRLALRADLQACCNMLPGFARARCFANATNNFGNCIDFEDPEEVPTPLAPWHYSSDCKGKCDEVYYQWVVDCAGACPGIRTTGLCVEIARHFLTKCYAECGDASDRSSGPANRMDQDRRSVLAACDSLDDLLDIRKRIRRIIAGSRIDIQ